MSEIQANEAVLLPLALCGTPPALEMILAQEGVPFRAISSDDHTRNHYAFTLFDGMNSRSRRLAQSIGGNCRLIDVNLIRRSFPTDPFACLVDHHAGARRWRVDDFEVQETVSRFDKAALRGAVVMALRDAVLQAGGIWLRVGRYPYPFRSAFSFRVDLDEHHPADYHAFALARLPIATCTTHFVSTAAYGDDAAVMRDLRRHDTQSHGHFHHVYRDERSNRRNLERAHACLTGAGFRPSGFAAPGGRWNAGLDRVLEDLGYLYSSDFQFSFDDWPAYPWLGTRFSRVLQVPIHPVCEGLFFEQTAANADAVADYLVSMLRAKVAAEEPAFLYGHPERRLGRFPAIVGRLAGAVATEPLVWKTTLTEYARWWARRLACRFVATRCADGSIRVVFEGEPGRDRLCLERELDDTVATMPLDGRVFMICDKSFEHKRKKLRFDAGHSTAVIGPRGLKTRVLTLLDWETVTPPEFLAQDTPTRWLKRRLRILRSRATGAPECDA